jgi:hypothetical protein
MQETLKDILQNMKMQLSYYGSNAKHDIKMEQTFVSFKTR